MKARVIIKRVLDKLNKTRKYRIKKHRVFVDMTMHMRNSWGMVELIGANPATFSVGQWFDVESLIPEGCEKDYEEERELHSVEFIYEIWHDIVGNEIHTTIFPAFHLADPTYEKQFLHYNQSA